MGRDMETFFQWLEQTAESEGVSEEELVNEMMSYYWIFNELSKTIGESSGGVGGSDVSSILGVEDGGTGPAGTSDGETEADETDSVEGSESAGRPEGGASDEEVEHFTKEVENLQQFVQSLQKLRQGLDELDGQSGNVGGVSLPQGFPQSVGFQQQPQPQGSAIGDVRSLFREIDDVVDDLQELESQQREHADHVSNELRQLEDQIEDLKQLDERISTLEEDAVERAEIAQLEDVATETAEELTAIRDHLDEIEQRQATLETENEEFETRIEREFDDIENIFEHLLGNVDDLEAQFEEWTSTYQADMGVIQRRIEKRNHLSTLRREADRKGVERGECDNCGERVTLSLLDSPDCPECEQQFSSIEDTWIPFRTPTLRTTPTPVTSLDDEDEREVSSLGEAPADVE